jgi:hypothetical protein
MEFKRCSKCGVDWGTREEFLEDPCVHLDGYQANFVDLEAGLFLFTHRAASCGTTMAIHAGSFADMHKGPIFEKSLRDTPECPKLCSRSKSLEACPLKCECAFVRDVLQKVLNWPKTPGCRAARQREGKQ